jgi:hypothetical protein
VDKIRYSAVYYEWEATMDANTERRARRAVNNALHTLTSNRYFDNLPLADIDTILTSNGFNSLEEGIYCGRDGGINEQVGDRTWLRLIWHKFDTGRYEVVAYIS